MRQSSRPGRKAVGSLTAVAVLATGLIVAPLAVVPAAASTPYWIGYVELTQTQSRPDPDQFLRMTRRARYTQSQTPSGGLETTFQASEDSFAEWYSTFPIRRLIRQMTTFGSGEGLGGSIELSYKTSEPAGYQIATSGAVFPLQTVTLDYNGDGSINRAEVNAMTPSIVEGAFVASPADDMFVLEGSQVRADFCDTNGICVHSTVSFRLRKLDCTDAPDADGDGLNECQEFDLFTDPLAADTDGDGLDDGDEFDLGTDPLAADTDGDGLSDGAEVNDHSTDPLAADTDGGGVSDGDELEAGTDPLDGSDDTSVDSDGDGVPNDDDNCPGTSNADQADVDGDGVGDVCDNCRLDSNPGQTDLDLDGLGDTCDPDIDGDGLLNGNEGPAGTSATNPDTDGDGVKDGADPCPLASGPVGSLGCPDEEFTCSSADPNKQIKIFDPTYTARVVLAGLPDAEFFYFSPSFIACWNGSAAAFKASLVDAGTKGGLDDAVLEFFGFTIGYVEGSGVLDVGTPGRSIATAEANANFEIEFDVMRLIDKVGIKGKIEGKLARKLEKRIEKILKKYSHQSPKFNKALVEWSRDVSDQILEAVDKTDKKLIRARVPDALAEELEDLVEDKFEILLREFRKSIGALASTNALYDKGAEEIADTTVGWLFDKLRLTIPFPMWGPTYSYTLDHAGNIGTSAGNPFVNPLLTIEEVTDR